MKHCIRWQVRCTRIRTSLESVPDITTGVYEAVLSCRDRDVIFNRLLVDVFYLTLCQPRTIKLWSANFPLLHSGFFLADLFLSIAEQVHVLVVVSVFLVVGLALNVR